MTPTEAILAGVNGTLGYLAMLRELLAHADWRVSSSRDVLVSSEAAHAAAIEQDAAIGAVSTVNRLEDVIADLDPTIVVLRIDPGSTISLSIQTDRLDAFRRLARGARAELALANADYASIKRYDAYFVPYFGELGNGHQIIAVPTPHGKMVAAFTAEDRVDTFLATGSDSDRANVKFIKVDGMQLFSSAHSIAEGVIVNLGSDKPVGFMLDACRDITAA